MRLEKAQLSILQHEGSGSLVDEDQDLPELDH
jgi:hypothetical protein